MKSGLLAVLLAVALKPAAVSAGAGPLVYVPLGSENEILVVQTSDDRVVGTITGVEDVHGLAGSRQGRYLVAGRFSAVEPGRGTVPAKPAGMSEAAHLAHHSKSSGDRGPEPQAVSVLSVIRAADGEIVRRVEVPGAVHHTALTPDGGYAVATHPNAGGVSVVDLSTFSVAKTIKTGALPNYAVASPDGRRVYVSNAGSGTVSEIATEDWTVLRDIEISGGPEHMVLSRDGETLYVNSADLGTVSVVSLPSGEIARTIQIDGGTHGIDLSDDGNTLYVAGRERNTLVAVNLRDRTIRAADLGPAPYHLTTIAGTGKLYVSSAEEPRIWVVDQRTLRPMRVIAIRGEGHQMAVVPGG